MLPRGAGLRQLPGAGTAPPPDAKPGAPTLEDLNRLETMLLKSTDSAPLTDQQRLVVQILRGLLRVADDVTRLVAGLPTGPAQEGLPFTPDPPTDTPPGPLY